MYHININYFMINYIIVQYINKTCKNWKIYCILLLTGNFINVFFNLSAEKDIYMSIYTGWGKSTGTPK